MLLRVGGVISREALPDIIADQSSHHIDSLNGPAAEGQVACRLVEEVSLEDSVVEHEVIALRLILHATEVRVHLHGHGVVLLETEEGLVALNFVLRRQLHGAMRHDVAIVLDSEDMIVQAIDLSQI